jgi:hypothetical protein
MRSGAYLPHLIWLIDNHAKHGVHSWISADKKDESYKLAGEHWLRQLRKHPDDVTILVHAAQFHSRIAPAEAAKYLLRASELDQIDEELPRKLCWLYCQTPAASDFKAKQLARKGIEQFKIAMDRFSNRYTDDSYFLPYFRMEVTSIAEVALYHNFFDDAQEFSRMLFNRASIIRKVLKQDAGFRSDAISDNLAHAILGRIAIRSGQIDLAKQHLSDMIALPFSQQSDWRLADELDELGENALVYRYVEHAMKYWQAWIADREHGSRAEDMEGALSNSNVKQSHELQQHLEEQARNKLLYYQQMVDWARKRLKRLQRARKAEA